MLIDQFETEKNKELDRIKNKTIEILKILDKKYVTEDRIKTFSPIISIVILVGFSFIILVNDVWNLIKNTNRTNLNNHRFKFNVRLTRSKVGLIKWNNFKKSKINKI